jgi:sialidase-1
VQQLQLLKGAGSESTFAQTPNGNLYRNDGGASTLNYIYRSVARGTLSSFGAFAADTGLLDPGCEGSVLMSYNYDSPARTVFLNSADASSRRQMRVRISYDSDAKKFDFGRYLSDAPLKNAGYEGGYSSMTKTPDFKIGALVASNFYEDGNNPGSHMCIIWRHWNLSWVVNCLMN